MSICRQEIYIGNLFLFCGTPIKCLHFSFVLAIWILYMSVVYSSFVGVLCVNYGDRKSKYAIFCIYMDRLCVYPTIYLLHFSSVFPIPILHMRYKLSEIHGWSIFYPYT